MRIGKKAFFIFLAKVGEKLKQCSESGSESISVHRVHMFLGLPVPDPDPLLRGMDPDPSIIKQK
jgi:hypothetical protein